MIRLSEESIKSYSHNYVPDILFSLNNGLAVSPAFKIACIKKIIRQCASLQRKSFLHLIPKIYELACSILPESEHQHLAEQFTLATIDAGKWWP
jgi:hypothetical protein